MNSTRHRVLGVLAGQDMPLSLLEKWARSAEIVLAADAGLDRLLDVEVSPDAVVGDFDSTQALEVFGQEKARHFPSELATDCDKLLAMADFEGFEAITLASVEGDQLDHMLATLHSAARAPLTVRIALRTGIGWVLNAGGEVVVRTTTGRRVSLLPLEACSGVHLSGVKWPLERADLHPSGKTSISNRASEPVVVASIGSGSAFLFVGFPEEEMPVW